VTPYPEITLIRKGKTSAAISFGGAIVGFVIPLGSAISQSVSFTDMLIWSIIALAVQIAVFFGLKLVFANLTREIEENHAAPATLMAFCSVACGILNAACMTY
jgi:putative membrane protein